MLFLLDSDSSGIVFVFTDSFIELKAHINSSL